MPVTLSSDAWIDLATRVFGSWGAPADVAGQVARSLVESDLSGVASHGVVRIPVYEGHWRAGWLQPGNRAEVVRDAPGTALIDGRWGFGQPAMHLALDVAIEKCRTQGIAGVGVIHSGHIGRLGEYAEKAVAAGAVAIVAASGGPPGGSMTPYGGAQRVLGTNPLAAGVPAGEHTPFVMDYATSHVAAGKLDYGDMDRVIPEGWAVDAEGRPARTVRDYMEGGGLLPFGWHKGFALALFIELLCGGVTGGGLSELPDKQLTFGAGGNAGFAIAIDVAHFRDPGEFGESVDAFMDRLRRVRPAPGSPGVIIPGEPEAEQRARRRAEGISVDDALWARIAATLAPALLSGASAGVAQAAARTLAPEASQPSLQRGRGP
jgi:LDH2 family malate/lactate/ureidoglycolate dehydrogenase